MIFVKEYLIIQSNFFQSKLSSTQDNLLEQPQKNQLGTLKFFSLCTWSHVFLH